MADTQKDKETSSRTREFLRAARDRTEDALTSDAAKFVYECAKYGAGSALAASLVMGGLAAMVGREFEEELPGAVRSNFSVTQIPEEGSCYFKDPARETKLIFRELPAGDFTEGFSFVMPFMKYNEVKHDVGTFPRVGLERCDLLKPDLILKPEEAAALMVKARQDFMNSQSLKDVRKALQSGEGVFSTQIVPKNAPRP